MQKEKENNLFTHTPQLRKNKTRFKRSSSFRLSSSKKSDKISNNSVKMTKLTSLYSCADIRKLYIDNFKKTNNIHVIGSPNCGKTTLIHVLESINNPIDIPKKPRRKKQNRNKQSNNITTNSTITSQSTLNLSFEEIIGDIPSKSENSMLFVYDVTDEDSLLYIEDKFKYVQKKNVFIILIANKIDLLGENNTSIDKGLLQGYKLSLLYNCKFIAISSLLVKNPHIIGNFSPAFQRRQLMVILFLLQKPSSIVEYKYKHNLLDNMTIIFTDYIHVTKETSVLLSISSEIDGTPHYAMLKGEYLILFSLNNASHIYLLYLPICNVIVINNIIQISNNDNTLYIKQSDNILSNEQGNTDDLIINWIQDWKSFCYKDLKRYTINNDNNLSELHQFYSILEDDIKTNINSLPFSCYYNLCSRMKCIDCNNYGCYFISIENATLLCDSCASCHNFELYKKNTTIVNVTQPHLYNSLLCNLGPKSNLFFNLLWEATLRKKDKIKNRSSLEERNDFIRKKYINLQYYSSIDHLLYVKLNDNLTESWIKRYLFLSPFGKLFIYSDTEHKQLLESFHVNQCFLQKPPEDLDSCYLHIIGPNSSHLFRASSPELSQCWLSIIQASQIRNKKYMISSDINRVNPKDSNPKPPIQELLLEKSHLVGIRKLLTQRKQLKQKLLQQLQEIDFEITGLTETETQSISKINELEPTYISKDINKIQRLVSFECSTKDINRYSEYIKSNKIIPLNAQTTLKMIQNTIHSIEDGKEELDSNGYVISATLNRIITILVNGCEEMNYSEIFFTIYPYIITPIDLLKELCIRFGISHLETNIQKKIVKDTQSMNLKIDIQSQIGDKISIISKEKCDEKRIIILKLIELWMSKYWCDFMKNPSLITFLLSFIDYVIQPISNFYNFAEILRGILQEQYNFYSPKNITNNLPKQTIITIEHFIIEIEAIEIVKHLCLLTQTYFNKIHEREFVDKSWNRTNKQELAPNITRFILLFNQISNWVAYSILNQHKNKSRVKALDKFIQIALYCKEYNNYHALIAIIGALQDSSISRCKKIWSMISVKQNNIFLDLVSFISVENNWIIYREQLSLTIKEKLPCIPYIGLYLKDLTFIEDGITNNHINDSTIINFSKYRKIALLIKEIMFFKNITYNFINNPTIKKSLQNNIINIPLLSEQERYNKSLEIESKTLKKLKE